MDLVILGTASLLCVAAFLCAIVFAIGRRPMSVRNCGLAVVGLSSLIIADVIVAPLFGTAKSGTAIARAVPPPVAMTSAPHTSPPTPARTPIATPAPTPTVTPPPTPSPTPTPVPSPSPSPTVSVSEKPAPARTATPWPAPSSRTADAQTLRTFRTYWAEIVRVSALALKAHDTAGEYLRRDDAAHATVQLKKCQDTAPAIVSGSLRLPLDSANGSDSELMMAIKKVGDGLAYGCKSAQSYLNTNAPSDFTEAKAHFADVAEGIFQSESLARSKYQRMGGNPDSLVSFRFALR